LASIQVQQAELALARADAGKAARLLALAIKAYDPPEESPNGI
jgi:hypothetical protein